MEILAVFIGGGIGSILRYLLSRLISENFISDFPFGTLAVNLAGTLLIGLLYGLSEKALVAPALRLFVFTGILGGFTTFSTFGLETFNLARGGNTGMAVLNLAVSNIAGIILVLAGYALAGILLKKGGAL